MLVESVSAALPTAVMSEQNRNKVFISNLRDGETDKWLSIIKN
jgi:hypothetical protein